MRFTIMHVSGGIVSYTRTRNRFDPLSDKPFKLSRSKLDLFLNCPRCFYLDRRLGIGQPPGYPFNLNIAVDTLLKKEFDHYRERGIPHPLMTKNKIKAVPFKHEKLDHWRDALRGGIDFHHQDTNLILSGGIDDLWINGKSELIIVDYKATSKADKISINADWQIGYRRQLEIYSWLFKKNNFSVAKEGYFVYCNGLTNRESFEARLDFDIYFLSYSMNDSWVEEALIAAHRCLVFDEPPIFNSECKFCGYQEAVRNFDSQTSFSI